MRTIKLTLAYDGTDFSGWQWQPDRPTIQREVMRAAGEVFGVRTQIDASGRTDAGVHALGQVASLRTPARIPCENLVKALNRLLPFTIRILNAEEVPETFHARFSARAKTYRYRIVRAAVCQPDLYRYVHHHPFPLDPASMAEAASLFVGEHDFTSFAAAGDPSSPVEDIAPNPRGNVRTVYSADLAATGDELVYTVRGSGFLHHMVRNMVGTLIEVGKGRLPPDEIPRIMAERRRAAAGPTAPAKGLWLVSVEYE